MYIRETIREKQIISQLKFKTKTKPKYLIKLLIYTSKKKKK